MSLGPIYDTRSSWWSAPQINWSIPTTHNRATCTHTVAPWLMIKITLKEKYHVSFQDTRVIVVTLDAWSIYIITLGLKAHPTHPYHVGSHVEEHMEIYKPCLIVPYMILDRADEQRPKLIDPYQRPTLMPHALVSWLPWLLIEITWKEKSRVSFHDTRVMAGTPNNYPYIQ